MNKIVVLSEYYASGRSGGGLPWGRIADHAERVGGPCVLLRRLRETMAEQVSAQERLDKIVVDRGHMVAEVCSCYAARRQHAELYATEGLKREAVHRTVLSAQKAWSVLSPARRRCQSSDAQAIRRSRIARKPAKKSTTPSSACRCCAPATRSACSWCRTAPAHDGEEVEAL
jgi:hypothetical protein